MDRCVRVARDAPCAGAWQLVLDDPEHANAISPRLVRDLHGALEDAISGGAHTVVLSSSGRRFCAGFDLSDIETVEDAELRERFESIEALLERIRRAPAVTIALVRGPALGAGADIVAACDYRIGSDDARLGFPGIRFGVILGTRHLAGLLGEQRARELLLEGRIVDAATALEIGLLSERCTPEDFDARVAAIAGHAAALDRNALEALLRLTRMPPSEVDMQELKRSTSTPGLAERMRAHARRVLPARKGSPA
jgi:enoyl-CoA hydratase